ncbi:hypothetical protein BP5796_07480 [Coleophoma crateriformis]|uniref:Uncharacterized protein n=1 Tax=Coleophoma crateriformis TaxID=565419 RepID=A0A3D8RJD1_9HELO|nr:hypothetical protein BP5796_07480 [Coleophoma crateriformis]
MKGPAQMPSFFRVPGGLSRSAAMRCNASPAVEIRVEIACLSQTLEVKYGDRDPDAIVEGFREAAQSLAEGSVLLELEMMYTQTKSNLPGLPDWPSHQIIKAKLSA